MTTKYRIILKAMSVEKVFDWDLTYEEACEICGEFNYEWCDPDSRFVWDMWIEEM